MQPPDERQNGPEASGGPRLASGTALVERTEALAALGHVLEQSRQGNGQVLFIVGEAGLGKTSLLRYASSVATGFALGEGTGSSFEKALPFGLLDHALSALGCRSLRARSGSLPADRRAAAFYSALHWLESAAPGPVLLLLDDIHWADPDSLSLLGFLAKRAPRLAVGIVATLRPWPQPARLLALALAQAGFAAMEKLGPLSQDGARQVLAARLPEPPTEDQSIAAYRLTAGNPLLLEHVASASQVDGAWSNPAQPAPPELLVLARFAGLDRDGLSYAQAASVLGIEFDPQVAATMAGLDGPRAEAAWRRLLREGLVRPGSNGSANFVHPLFAQSLYEDIPPVARERLHAQAFQALLARGAPPAIAAAHALEGHLTGNPQAVSALEAAGRAADRAGATEAAAAHFAHAVELAGPSARPGLRLRLAEAHLGAGRPGQALAELDAVLHLARLSRRERVEAHRLIATAQLLSGSFERALDSILAAVDDLQEPGPVGASLLAQGISFALMAGGPNAARPMEDRARALAASATPEVASLLLAHTGAVSAMKGLPAGWETLSGALHQAHGGGSLAKAFNEAARALYIVAASSLERFDDAMGMLQVALAQAERFGSVSELASYCVDGADVMARCGRLDEAADLLERCGPVADLVPAIVPSVVVARAYLAYERGEQAEAQRMCAAAEHDFAAMRGWVPHFWLELWALRARLALDLGRPAEAADLCAQVEQLAHSSGFREPCLYRWHDVAVAAHVVTGRLDEARRLLADLDSLSAPLPCRWPRAVAMAGHAQVAEASGDPGASEMFEQAASTLRGSPLVLAHAEALLAAGRHFRRSGQLARARELLAEALSTASGVGAARLAREAAAERAAAGGRRLRASHGSRLLSAQEERVAQAAAKGLTNAEIAARLFLSRKTVDHHLQAVFTKLGLHSRRELMTSWPPAQGS